MSDQTNEKCPLYLNKMDLTDKQLKPCKCGYEVNIQGFTAWVPSWCADNLFYVFSMVFIYLNVVHILCLLRLFSIIVKLHYHKVIILYDYIFISHAKRWVINTCSYVFSSWFVKLILYFSKKGKTKRCQYCSCLVNMTDAVCCACGGGLFAWLQGQRDFFLFV